MSDFEVLRMLWLNEFKTTKRFLKATILYITKITYFS